MTFVLRIDTGGSAFEVGDDGEHYPYYELARILRAVALQLDTNEAKEGRVRDVNGNTVGDWIISGRTV